jgi:L-asparagine transporter-like permease
MTFRHIEIGALAGVVGLAIFAGLAVRAKEPPGPDQLVDALNGVFGKHPGNRAAHTKVICWTGLFANSLIGALAISPAVLWENKWVALAMLAAGLLISGAWLIITVQAWSVMRRHEDLVGSFAASCFKHLPNPFADTLSNRARTSICRLLLLVVGIFVLMYLGLGYVRLVL